MKPKRTRIYHIVINLHNKIHIYKFKMIGEYYESKRII